MPEPAADRDAPPRRSWLAFLLHPKFAIPAMLVGLLALAPFLYRDYRLARIPDVEEPFDVEAFLDFEIDEDAGPWKEYARAEAMLVDSTKFHGTTPEELEAFNAAYDHGWSHASEEFKKYFDANRSALYAMRDAMLREAVPRMHPRDRSFIELELDFDVQASREFARLAVIEAERLEAEQNLDNAVHLLLASTRGAHLRKSYGNVIERLVANAQIAVLGDALAEVAANNEVSPKLLRDALHEVRRLRSLVPPVSQTFKVEFVAMVNYLEDVDLHKLSEVVAVLGEPVEPWRLWIENEPAVALRLLKHEMHYMLSVADKPRHARGVRPPGTGPWHPATPPTPNVLPSAELTDMVKASPVATEVLTASGQFLDAFDRQAATQRALECVLAAELFRRERGAYPEALAALVPDYLDAVPLDPFGGPTDEMRYEIRGGRPVVWSVGDDGVDDGGTIDGHRNRFDVGINVRDASEVDRDAGP